MQLFTDSYDRCKESEETEKYENNSYIIATELEAKGECEQALKIYEEILANRCKSTDMTHLADSLNRIGCLYMMKNDFFKADQYFRKALKYRSLENDLIGFCTVHINLSKMYFLQSLYTNESRYLNHAVWSLDLALKHLSKKSQPKLYKEWELKYPILQVQLLRHSSETESEDYRGALSELTEFYDTIKENLQSEMQNIKTALENNIAVILALMGENDKACELIKKCLTAKEVLKEVFPTQKTTSYTITKTNLKAIKENRLQDLIFEY